MTIDRTVTTTFLGIAPYQHTLAAMCAHVAVASEHALWVVEHLPVYSLGQRQILSQVSIANGTYDNQQNHYSDLNHAHQTYIDPATIERIQSDRGGLTTYHGPGQVIFYCLFHLPSLDLGIKSFVYLLEQSVIDALEILGVSANRIVDKPGVYIHNRKVASLGVKVTKGWSYHGIACNFDMDLAPFLAIDPCGWHGLRMCNLIDSVPHVQKREFTALWHAAVCRRFDLVEKIG